MIQDLEAGKESNFYRSRYWKKLKNEVLKADNFECVLCKREGRYSKGEIVHHINHLKDRPDLALSMYDENGERNLISLCKYHHELQHPESLKRVPAKPPVTEERWD